MGGVEKENYDENFHFFPPPTSFDCAPQKMVRCHFKHSFFFGNFFFLSLRHQMRREKLWGSYWQKVNVTYFGNIFISTMRGKQKRNNKRKTISFLSNMCLKIENSHIERREAVCIFACNKVSQQREREREKMWVRRNANIILHVSNMLSLSISSNMRGGVATRCWEWNFFFCASEN